MRCFIGLDLTAQQKLALQSWQQKALPEIRSRNQTPSAKRHIKDAIRNAPAIPVAVPAANYHITLAFLGHLSSKQQESLIMRLDEVHAHPVMLQLNRTGYWQKPKIVFVAPEQTPPSLGSLHTQIRKAAREAGIETENRDYHPHVTLMRKAPPSLPPPLFAPDITCEFNAFHLFESVSTPNGVSYPIRRSWKLAPDLNVREKLRRGLI
ncbi:RNA 2',3'-cyclic phosphodiesterase [Alteromonas ponticola]|uniref:RNA 2',3'-cyclic phosphodiesterase n=1 Tax=Alteromonas aquimaris TaxID=2998417 RepID=A0ABT3PAQ3_9ALTE|nr:RNA 2',3'-cyclic phosphodiesterase [Alteromonas aquimaris]MCW8109789.1 RNA 2',3'-cyclic phosphodiesterase [Alteromonas aquimaris]